MKKDSIEDQVYRANFKAKNGYDPGPYGECDVLTIAFVVVFLIYLAFGIGSK